jgi:hypothetical protein
MYLIGFSVDFLLVPFPLIWLIQNKGYDKVNLRDEMIELQT